MRGGTRRGKELGSMQHTGETIVFFLRGLGLVLSVATELRHYKLPERPVLRETVLKEERERN